MAELFSFFEALDKLKAGKCREIQPESAYCNMHYFIRNNVLICRETNAPPVFDVVRYQELWRLIDPIPETIKVEGWVNVYPPAAARNKYLYESEAKAKLSAFPDAIACIHVTGSAPAPVKEKVKHREECPVISGCVSTNGVATVTVRVCAGKARSKFYEEWED